MLVVGVELPDVFHKLFDRDGLHVIWEENDTQSHTACLRTTSSTVRGAGDKCMAFGRSDTTVSPGTDVLQTSIGVHLTLGSQCNFECLWLNTVFTKGTS